MRTQPTTEGIKLHKFESTAPRTGMRMQWQCCVWCDPVRTCFPLVFVAGAVRRRSYCIAYFLQVVPCGQHRSSRVARQARDRTVFGLQRELVSRSEKAFLQLTPVFGSCRALGSGFRARIRRKSESSLSLSFRDHMVSIIDTKKKQLEGVALGVRRAECLDSICNITPFKNVFIS